MSGDSKDTSRVIESRVVWLARTDCSQKTPVTGTAITPAPPRLPFCHPDLALRCPSSRPGPTKGPEVIRVPPGRKCPWDQEQTWKTTRCGNGYQGRQESGFRHALHEAVPPHRKPQSPDSLGSARALTTPALLLVAMPDQARQHN